MPLGIPNLKRIKRIPVRHNPDNWEYVLHSHAAERAGKHYDLRLSDGKDAHSWAMRYPLPAPGKTRLAIQQPTHVPEYMKFKGTIEEGYGKGKVKIEQEGSVKVLSSSPKGIHFAILNKKDPEEFLMVPRKNDEKNWYVINVTPTRKTKKIPNAKPKYKDTKDIEEVLDSKYVVQPKIDGAHVIWDFSSNRPRVFSYRPSQRSDRLIQHTFKIPELDKIKTPASLKGTIIRGELYGVDPSNTAVSPRELNPLLNSTTENSIKLQNETGVSLRSIIFDLVKHKGKNVEKLPYEEKLKILQEVTKQVPILTVPEQAQNIESKRELLNKILKGRHKDTKEGIVAWNLENSERPIRLKIRPTHDVYIKDIFPSTRKNEAGGFMYSLTPRGSIVGKVGTGFSRELRKDMLKDPKKFIGRSAKVTAQEQFPSGALRAPAFDDFHLEKGKWNY